MMTIALEAIDDLIDQYVLRNGVKPHFLILPADVYDLAVTELERVRSLVNRNGILYLRPTYRRVVLVKQRDIGS